MANFRKEFSTVTWVMIPVAIAINIAIGQLALSLPIYLDTIGTVLVGVLAYVGKLPYSPLLLFCSLINIIN